jgi:hypothetical protein
MQRFAGCLESFSLMSFGGGHSTAQHSTANASARLIHRRPPICHLAHFVRASSLSVSQGNRHPQTLLRHPLCKQIVYNTTPSPRILIFDLCPWLWIGRVPTESPSRTSDSVCGQLNTQFSVTFRRKKEHCTNRSIDRPLSILQLQTTSATAQFV